MHLLYTLGYRGRFPEEIAGLVWELDALLVDIRYSPRSPNSAWSREALRDLVGHENYLHLQALGNRNYRDGGPIRLHDPEAAVPVLAEALAARPVILLCACRDVESCHRKVAAEYLAGRLGAQVVHLEWIKAVRCPVLARLALRGHPVDPVLRRGEPVERYCPAIYNRRACCPPGMRPEIIRVSSPAQLRLVT